PQAFMAAEELPDEIKRRLPDAANVSTERAPPRRGERLRADGFGDNLIIHRRFPLYSFNLGNESYRTPGVSGRATLPSDHDEHQLARPAARPSSALRLSSMRLRSGHSACSHVLRFGKRN